VTDSIFILVIGFGWPACTLPNGWSRAPSLAGRQLLEASSCRSSMPSFGTIKIVQQRCPGAPIKLCKAALVDNDDDIDAAAAHIDATTEFKDINPPARTSSDGVGGGNTTYADHLAGRPCMVDCTEQNAPVVVIRIEVGDGPGPDPDH